MPGSWPTNHQVHCQALVKGTSTFAETFMKSDAIWLTGSQNI